MSGGLVRVMGTDRQGGDVSLWGRGVAAGISH